MLTHLKSSQKLWCKQAVDKHMHWPLHSCPAASVSSVCPKPNWTDQAAQHQTHTLLRFSAVVSEQPSSISCVDFVTAMTWTFSYAQLCSHRHLLRNVGYLTNIEVMKLIQQPVFTQTNICFLTLRLCTSTLPIKVADWDSLW